MNQQSWVAACLMAFAASTACAEGAVGTSGGPEVPFNGCIAYENRDFQGATFTLRGNVNLQYVGDRWNDKISSFACRARCNMTFFEHRDFKGAHRTWATTQYVGDDWNDSISSLYVRCASAAPVSEARVYAPKVTFCNRTPPDLQVAAAFDLAGTAQITSEGWWNVRGCSCKTIVNKQLRASEIFLLIAEPGSTESLVAGAAPVCVNPSRRFSFRNENTGSAQCAQAGGKWVTFKRYDTGGKDYTLNFRHQSGEQCIDMSQ